MEEFINVFVGFTAAAVAVWTHFHGVSIKKRLHQLENESQTRREEQARRKEENNKFRDLKFPALVDLNQRYIAVSDAFREVMVNHAIADDDDFLNLVTAALSELANLRRSTKGLKNIILPDHSKWLEDYARSATRWHLDLSRTQAERQQSQAKAKVVANLADLDRRDEEFRQVMQLFLMPEDYRTLGKAK